ncbi:hypothetical protein [Nocardioides sp. P86]|nr:hypothetical protein [Nocardioides sp. P86]MCM3514882.1 hypothetical protein [Nocardioides sp. P86]
MNLPRLRRPTPSMAVSVMALVVAMGGTSYAAVKISSEDVVNNSLTGQDIKNDSVASIDVKNGTLQAKDFRDGTLVQGPAGPAGADGAGRWVLVGADGSIVDQSGGFSIVAAYPTLPNTAPAGSPDNSLRANGNVYISAGDDISDSGLVATISLQNTVDQNGDGVTTGRAPGADANPEFSGEISVSRCNVGAPTTPPSGPTNCAPAGAQNAQSFVVSPRNSDGSVTTDGTRKPFYVVLTEAPVPAGR